MFMSYQDLINIASSFGWQVIEADTVDCDGVEAYGFCDFEARIIKVRKSRKYSWMAATLAHEVCHMIIGYLPDVCDEIDSMPDGEEVEEVLCDEFACRVGQDGGVAEYRQQVPEARWQPRLERLLTHIMGEV